MFSVIKAIGLIADAIPSTMRKLNILEPMALPSAISTSFFLAATIDVTSSGSDVPIATTVRAITLSLIPINLAIALALFTTNSPPPIMANNFLLFFHIYQSFHFFILLEHF